MKFTCQLSLPLIDLLYFTRFISLSALLSEFILTLSQAYMDKQQKILQLADCLKMIKWTSLPNCMNITSLIFLDSYRIKCVRNIRIWVLWPYNLYSINHLIIHTQQNFFMFRVLESYLCLKLQM